MFYVNVTSHSGMTCLSSSFLVLSRLVVLVVVLAVSERDTDHRSFRSRFLAGGATVRLCVTLVLKGWAGQSFLEQH